MACVSIVDDSAFMRHLVRRLVEGAGHDVIAEAADGQGISAQADLTVLDLFLPGQGGLALLEQLFEQDPDARVIAYAEPWQEEDAVRAIRLGARDVLVKPLVDVQFEDALAAALR